jgi:hypothetical protein
MRRSLLVAAVLSLVLCVAAPPLAPAAGGGGQPVGAAKKKCKKGYKRVKGHCKKKKKKKSSGGNVYRGQPPEITVSVSGSTATFKWSPVKCSASGVPSSITESAQIDRSNPSRPRFLIDKQLNATYKLKVLGQFPASNRIDGSVRIVDASGATVCGPVFQLKK